MASSIKIVSVTHHDLMTAGLFTSCIIMEEMCVKICANALKREKSGSERTGKLHCAITAFTSMTHFTSLFYFPRRSSPQSFFSSSLHSHYHHQYREVAVNHTSK